MGFIIHCDRELSTSTGQSHFRGIISLTCEKNNRMVFLSERLIVLSSVCRQSRQLLVARYWLECSLMNKSLFTRLHSQNWLWHCMTLLKLLIIQKDLEFLKI